MAGYVSRLKHLKRKLSRERELRKELELDRKENVALILEIADNFADMLRDPRYIRAKEAYEELRDGLLEQLTSKPLNEKSESIRVAVKIFDKILNVPVEYINTRRELMTDENKEAADRG